MSGDEALLSRATRLVVGRGLLSAADVHRFGVRARDLSQSNSVVLIECGDGRGFVVKDMHRRRDETQGSPAAELAFYRAASASPTLRGLVPGFLHYEEEGSSMILEALLTARRLDQCAGGKRALDAEIGGWLGSALGSFHRDGRGLAGELAPADPWMLHIDGDERLDILDRESRLREVVDRILSDRETRQLPGRVREQWRRERLIHGDVRFANVLVDTSPPGVHLIDWETVGCGDAAWDVGAAVQEYLSLGVAYGHSDVADSPGLPAIAAMLAAHAAASGDDVDWPRLAPCVACRLLMRAVQLANWERDSAAAIDLHLRMAADVAREGGALFEAPDRAVS